MTDKLPAPLRVVAQAIVTWWDAAISLALLNMIWVLAWVTLIFGPPVTFGLYYVASELAHGRDAGLSGLLTGARRYFWQSWLWALPNLLLIAVVIFEAPFLQRYPVFVPFTGIGIVVWLTVQFYSLPYFMEQEAKNILVAWRNGLFTALASPFYTLVVISCVALLLAVSSVTAAPLLFGSISLIAVLGTTAVLDRIQAFGLRNGPSKH